MANLLVPESYYIRKFSAFGARLQLVTRKNTGEKKGAESGSFGVALQG
jgi:hypothetical protein